MADKRRQASASSAGRDSRSGSAPGPHTRPSQGHSLSHGGHSEACEEDFYGKSASTFVTPVLPVDTNLKVKGHEGSYVNGPTDIETIKAAIAKMENRVARTESDLDASISPSPPLPPPLQPAAAANSSCQHTDANNPPPHPPASSEPMATPLPQAATYPPGLGFQQASGFAAAEAHGTEGSFGDGVPQVIRPLAGGGNTRVGDSSRVGAQSAGVGWDQPPADTVLQLQEEVDKMKQEVIDLKRKQAGTQAQLARKRAREAEWCEEAGRVAVAVAEGMKGFKDDMVSSINEAGNAAVQAGRQADKQLQAADHGVSACKKLKGLTGTLESLATSVNAQEAAEDEHAD